MIGSFTTIQSILCSDLLQLISWLWSGYRFEACEGRCGVPGCVIFSLGCWEWMRDLEVGFMNFVWLEGVVWTCCCSRDWLY